MKKKKFIGFTTLSALKSLVFLMAAFLFCWVGFNSCFVYAADDEPKPSENQVKSDQSIPMEIKAIQERIEAIEASIKETVALEKKGSISQEDVGENGFKLKLLKLSNLKAAYLNLDNALETKSKFQDEEKLVSEQDGVSVDEFISQKPPYALSSYDLLLGQVQIIRQKEETARFAAKKAKISLNEAEKRLVESQKQRETLENEPADRLRETEEKRRNRLLEIASIDEEQARVNVETEKLDLENQNTEIRLAKLKTGILNRAIAKVREQLSYNEEDLQLQLSQLDSQIQAIKKDREKLIEDQNKVEDKWRDAQEALNLNVDPEKRTELEALVIARHSWLETYIRVVEHLWERIGLLEHSKETLKKRYALIKGEIGRKQLIEWKGDLGRRIEELAKTLFLQQRLQASVQSQMGLLEKTLTAKPPGSKLRSHLETRIGAYKSLVERSNEHVLALLDAILVDQRLDDELDLQLKQVGLPGKILAFMTKSRQIGSVMIVAGTILLALFVVFVLNRILKVLVKKTSFRFDDQLLKTIDRPVFWTIILAGLLTAEWWSPFRDPFDFIFVAVLQTILIFIWSMALGRIFHQVGKDLVGLWRRRGRQGTEMIIMAEHLARLIVILGAVFLVLTAWQINITPLLASAGIAGVAVALAAKETLSNFFGGISLMFDQPFKTGDYIILDSGERGEVMQIGMRSTRILTRDEILISIPNSVITNAKIINESAPLPRFRVRIKIGVAYGSDIKKVEEVLLKVAKNDRMVVPKPDPRVRFRSFGDSSLDFELLCWGHSPEQKGRLIHNLNSEVYMAFEKEGIVIPFPQRDVYLRPIAEEQKPDDTLPST